MVGAPEEVRGQSPTDCGRAYLFSGATGVLRQVFAPGSPQVAGKFGFAVAGVPDFTGDGRGDIAIGSDMRPPNELNYGGRVFLYSGWNGAFVRVLASPRKGEMSGFGMAVAGMSDANGNGKGDVVVGSPFESTPTVERAGRAYLFRN